MFDNVSTLKTYFCRQCSTPTTLVWHTDGNCPKDYHRCIICKSEIKVGTPYDIEIPGGSAYSGLHICCVCLDEFIFKVHRLEETKMTDIIPSWLKG